MTDMTNTQHASKRDVRKVCAELPLQIQGFLQHRDHHLRQCYTDSVEMFPDAKICISELIEKGKRLGVGLELPDITHRRDIRKIGHSRLLRICVGFDRCANGKPDPQPIILCLKELRSDASTAVMIGDSMSDVKAGRRACIDTVFLNRKSREVQCEPTYTRTDLREMLTPFHLCCCAGSVSFSGRLS